jgi:2-oxoglutarate dehydrogenase E1 component
MAIPEHLFDGPNAGYVQDLFEAFTRNPQEVPEAWRKIFTDQVDGLLSAGIILPDALQGRGQGGPALAPAAKGVGAATTTPAAAPAATTSAAPAGVSASATSGIDRLLPLIARAVGLIQAFRDHGHQLATVDPLGSPPPGHPQLDPSFFGTSLEELSEIPTSLVLPDGGDEPLIETLARLHASYCGNIGYQFEHLEDPEKVRWLWSEVESGRHSKAMPAEDRIRLLRRLTEVEGLERFLHRTYLGQKRFSIEGTDMLVPMLDEALHQAALQGGRLGVLGMAHRGRLNVLCHTVDLPYAHLLREFEGAPQTEGALAMPGTGDVKYHHGARGTQRFPDGHSIDVVLAPNPSHLEFVNPVVQGMSRALQFSGPAADATQDVRAVVPILIHGDAAFSAEGVVAESLNLARLRGYTVGGVIHIIANNQVGFTTDPRDGRSTRYASDVAKGYDLPVVHVNADDPEACLAAVRLAMAYRAVYQDDFVIDLVGYRRHGHNEGDEPSYTQPALYQRIAGHRTVRERFASMLIREGLLTEAEAQAQEEEILQTLRAAQRQVLDEKESASTLSVFETPSAEDPRTPAPATGFPLDRLAALNAGALAVPEGFSIHPKLKRQLQRRVDGFGPDLALEWAHAETLAFASLLDQGIPVRLSGQDCERGTFSQRHLVFHDHQTGARVLPLAELGSARFEVYNSPLSEVGVMGFEYGYSVAAEPDYVLWEGQFGDFVNVAQPIIDQFLAAGREKWGQKANLTLLLPHGYEGQGPEQSSARLERFLQLCGEDNLRVAYPTTPAQYFHLLRRHALHPSKRPLVVMTPKSLLRHPRATSPVQDLVDGAFRAVLPDPEVRGREGDITTLLVCAGKVYYDLQGAEGRAAQHHLAIARLEQFYPFPESELEALIAGFPNLTEVVWVQEEPQNMGGLSFVGPRLRAAVPGSIPIRAVSRPDRASTAEGRGRDHERNQSRLVREALGISEG